MIKKQNKNKIITRLVLLIMAVVLVVSMSACTLFAGIAGIVLNNTSTSLYDLLTNNFELNQPDNAVFGSDNGLAVGFDDGHLYAFWDSYGDGYVYNLKVVANDDTGVQYENISANYLDLEQYGYKYTDNLQLFLYKVSENHPIELLNNYLYKGIDENQFDKYSTNMSGGWDDLDTYLATRYEFFELYNYMVLFRPNSERERKDGIYYYSSELSMYLGYDYLSIYPEGTSYEDAYKIEIESAIAAFEDSAGYSYSYDIDEDNKTLTMYLRFDYDTTPNLQTSTNKYYARETAESGVDKPRYVLSEKPRVRNFPIDEVEKTVTVESSDQLYYALKKGYRPICVSGSNAEYIYNYIRNILARMNSDITTDASKINYVYDYLVDTVLYDYEFTNVMDEDDESSYEDLFSYKCLYLEGVFGMNADHTFKSANCVAICDGLAKATLCMLKIEGIDVIKVSGTSQGVAHAWNKVKLKGSWYMFDATWGNNLDKATHKEELTHDYLLVADDSDHIEDQWFAYPIAIRDYTGYSFLN